MGGGSPPSLQHQSSQAGNIKRSILAVLYAYADLSSEKADPHPMPSLPFLRKKQGVDLCTLLYCAVLLMDMPLPPSPPLQHHSPFWLASEEYRELSAAQDREATERPSSTQLSGCSAASEVSTLVWEKHKGSLSLGCEVLGAVAVDQLCCSFWLVAVNGLALLLSKDRRCCAFVGNRDADLL
eukprot:1157782-Pelagomonas_calceolata.AAC.6